MPRRVRGGRDFLVGSASALALVMGGIAMPQAAVAQSAAQNQVEVDIPAQDLNSALLLLTQRAGLQIAYDADKVAGRRSSTVKGRYSAVEALSQLLVGTGLTFRFTGNNRVALDYAPQSQSADGAIQLDPVRVQGEAGSGSGGSYTLAEREAQAVTEGTKSYTTRTTTTASRLPLSPRETPQTIAVVTRQQMDDFALTDVGQVLQNTSGISQTRAVLGSAYYSRGFLPQYQYDGVANVQESGYIASAHSTDAAILDHVEVLQGAAGLLTGAGNPGGTVNLVRKRPTEQFHAQIEGRLGSWSKRRLVGDISAPIIASGAVRARVVGVLDQANSFVDYVDTDKKVIYGIVEVLPSSSTTIGVGLHYQNLDNSDEGVGVPTAPDGSDLGWKRSTFFGLKDGFMKREGVMAFSYLEQRISTEWKLRLDYAYNSQRLNYLYGNQFGSVNLATGDGKSLRHNRIRQRFEDHSFGAYVDGKFDLFGQKHELMFGGNGYESTRDISTIRLASTPYNIYTYNPALIPQYEGNAPDLTRFQSFKNFGLFGVSRFSLSSNFKIIVGSRVSWYEYTERGVKVQDENAVISPYAGLVYDLTKSISLYASYSDIFTPQSQLDRTGMAIKPVVGSNYEAGIKGEFFDGRLNAAFALYRLEQTNLARQDVDFGNDPTNVCAGWCYIAEDKVVSRGVDISLNGSLTPNWNISAGYVYLDAEYASGASKGERFGSDASPKHNIRLSTTYRIPGTALTIGGNIRFQSNTYAFGTGYRIEQPSYALIGLMAKYEIGQSTDLNLIVSNLLDKKYWMPAAVNVNYYGEPRNILVTLRHKF